MAKNPLLRGLPPARPGEFLREDVLPALGRPKAEIARLLGVSRQTFWP
jgi:plasmid maintenance system antidote protein VapI